MPNFSNGLGTLASHSSAVGLGQLPKFAGLHQLYADVSALNTAVVAERGNIANSLPMWPEGQTFSLANEPPGVFRIWSRTNQNARVATIRPGLTVTLNGDTNIVRAAVSQPLNTTGIDGDISIDYNAGIVYRKTAGAWAIFIPTIFAATLSTEFNPPTSNPQNVAVLFDRTTGGGNTIVSSPVTTFTYDFPGNGVYHFNLRYNSAGEVVAVSAWGAGASGPVGSY
jgi:hypothetical protein